MLPIALPTSETCLLRWHARVKHECRAPWQRSAIEHVVTYFVSNFSESYEQDRLRLRLMVESLNKAAPFMHAIEAFLPFVTAANSAPSVDDIKLAYQDASLAASYANRDDQFDSFLITILAVYNVKRIRDLPERARTPFALGMRLFAAALGPAAHCCSGAPAVHCHNGAR